jgi:hypothetical protein
VPVPFLLALLGKAAAGAASKGLAAKGSAAAAKTASAHHGPRSFAKKVAGKIVDKARDEAIDRVLWSDVKQRQRVANQRSGD